MSNIFTINHLTYGNILKELSMTIDKKIVSISGPNNSGKTTLIRILGKEITEYRGLITWNEKNIEGYRLEEFEDNIQTVIPLETLFFTDNIVEEAYLENREISKEWIDYLLEGLKIKKLESKKINNYTEKEMILSQIFLALIHTPSIILLDSLSNYFNQKEIIGIIDFLKQYQEEHELMIIMTTIHLEDALLTDYLYILNDGQVALEGSPLEVLKSDNIINKIGLDIPFMVDLSVKLMDYDLLDKIVLSKDRMVEELWKK